MDLRTHSVFLEFELIPSHNTICEHCGKEFEENPETKDPGICSIHCGYAYRGMSWTDFL